MKLTNEQIDDLLNNKVITAVCIATPAVTHGDMVIKALNAGKHVFVEKPMCLDIEQAKQIIKLSEILKLKAHMVDTGFIPEEEQKILESTINMFFIS